MTRATPAALATVAALLAGCVAAPEPPKPVARAPADWFQQQLAQARQARASHVPKSDAAGAQADYDRVVHAACVRVALSGPARYQARCAAVLRQTPAYTPAQTPAQTPAHTPAETQAPADPFVCDDSASDPAAVKACND